METILSNFNGITIAFNPLSILTLFFIYKLTTKMTHIDKALFGLSKDLEAVKSDMQSVKTSLEEIKAFPRVTRLFNARNIPPPL